MPTCISCNEQPYPPHLHPVSIYFKEVDEECKERSFHGCQLWLKFSKLNVNYVIAFDELMQKSFNVMSTVSKDENASSIASKRLDKLEGELRDLQRNRDGAFFLL